MSDEIKAVHEMDVPSMGKCAEIRFDCLVKMFDAGIRTRTVSGIILSKEVALPPQWFKNELKLTLETVKYANPTELGNTLKTMFKQLEHHIDNYEKQ